MCRCVLPEENSAATCVFCDVRAVMVSLAGREVVEAEWFVKAMSGDRQDAAEFLSGFIDVLLRNSEGEPRFTSIFRQQSRIIQTCERCRHDHEYNIDDTMTLEAPTGGVEMLGETIMQQMDFSCSICSGVGANVREIAASPD